jgi:hypothetical protein
VLAGALPFRRLTAREGVGRLGVALRLLKIIGPYLVEQERMANAQLLRYGSKQTDHNSSN